jgi:hypothetical protein
MLDALPILEFGGTLSYSGRGPDASNFHTTLHQTMVTGTIPLLMATRNGLRQLSLQKCIVRTVMLH